MDNGMKLNLEWVYGICNNNCNSARVAREQAKFEVDPITLG